MNNPTSKALIAALAFLLTAVVLIACFHNHTRKRAGNPRTATWSDESTPADLFITDTETTPYEAYTEPQSETATEEPATETTTERKTIAPATTTEAYIEEIREVRAVPGDYIGTFTLTAYEWTGERMVNGEYPYYGACASNYFALGTVLYIEGYGTFVVKDRGGPSMGYDIIDIYLGDEDACWEFGVRTAEVYYG